MAPFPILHEISIQYRWIILSSFTDTVILCHQIEHFRRTQMFLMFVHIKLCSNCSLSYTLIDLTEFIFSIDTRVSAAEILLCIYSILESHATERNIFRHFNGANGTFFIRRIYFQSYEQDSSIVLTVIIHSLPEENMVPLHSLCGLHLAVHYTSFRYF